jgi:O-antigen ligase
MDPLRLGLIILMAAAAPLALGSVHGAGRAFLEAGTFLLVLTVIPLRDVGGNRTQRRLAARLMLPMALFVLLMALQLVPMPPEVLERISPGTAGRLTGLFGPGAGWRPLSLAPYETLQELLLWASYLGIFFVAATLRLPPPGLQPGSDVRWIRSVVVVLALVGFGEALYGLWQYFSRAELIMGWSRPYAGCATGTFVNRNHFAGYLNMTLFLTLGLLMVQWPRLLVPDGRLSGLRGRLFLMDDRRTLYLFVLLMAAVTVVLAIVFSLSRSGVATLAFGLALMSAFAGWARLPRGLRPLLLVAVLGFTWSWWKGLDPLLARFMELPGDVARLEIWRSSLPLVREFPAFGSGAGSFRWVFAPVQGHIFGSSIVDHAHQDYIELMLVTGVIGIVLFLWFWGQWFCATFRQWSRRHHPGVRGVAAGGGAAVSTLLLHGLTDFNWQIPANAWTTFLIAGMCFNLVHAEYGPLKRRPACYAGGKGGVLGGRM